MTRRRTTSRSFSFAALSLLASGLAACSFSFKTGSSASNPDGKPAVQPTAGEGTGTTTKPLAGAEAEAETPAETPAEERPVTEESASTPSGSGSLAAATVEARSTAVCRIRDPSLAALCHTALDPIAADDFEAWKPVLGKGVTLTRRSYQSGMQRMEGPGAIEAAIADGGLRSLLHLEPADRVVGTMHGDCRQCQRSFVAFETNSRSGTIVVTVDLSASPLVSSIEIGSRVQRRLLREARSPSAELKPPAGSSAALKPAESSQVEVKSAGGTTTERRTMTAPRADR